MIDLAKLKHAQELRTTWQGRALAYTRGKMAAVMLSVIANSYDEALEVLLRVVFPGFESVAPPFVCSCGRISHTGRIAANMITRDEQFVRNAVLFESENEMQGAFRTLADELMLDDAERIEMFAAAKRWLVADMRQNPETGERDE